MIVEDYLNQVLSPQLGACGLNFKQRELVLWDVRERLISVMGNWRDEGFRRAVLLLGLENAAFYEPCDVDIEIRALVAVAVRNSMLEDLTATYPYRHEFASAAECLPDTYVPEITRSAARFFAEAWRRKPDWMVAASRPDVFRLLAAKYPLTWQRLTQLASSPEQEQLLQVEAVVQRPAGLPGGPVPLMGAPVWAALSGYSPVIDPALAGILKNIVSGDMPYFYSPCFKTVTRNPEKLLHVIETLLCANKSFATLNYLIEPGYVSRRSPLVPPMHSQSDLADQLTNLTGLTQKHRQVLQAVSEGLENQS
jgi:hypothetical protein